MKCPDCKGSKIYQPFFGPPEACTKCGGSGNITDASRIRAAITTAWQGNGPKPIYTILVRNKYQRAPATVYGDIAFGPGNYKIEVCKDPTKRHAELGPDNSIVCHFN